MIEENLTATTFKKTTHNPFTLDSGRIPETLVRNTCQGDEIIDVFNEEVPVYKGCFITGIQGSGKTVSLTTIAKDFRGRMIGLL